MTADVYPGPLDEAERRRHKLRNLVQSALLLGGMIALLSACLWLIFGAEGVVWALLGWGIALAVSPRLSPRFILGLYRARRISPYEFPAGYGIVEELARRADLPRMPILYYVPSPTLNAFAVGSRDDAAIAITDGMLRALDLRELAGVLAHEISHVRNKDLWIMNLADSISRLTGVMSFAGMALLVVNIPLLLTAQATVPWLLVALLLAAPTLVNLLQLALSRAREFDADLDAAGLTRDPAGLASALDKLERYQGRFWEQIFMPGRGIPDPSLLRTHPPTEERIRRLASLFPRPPAAPFRTAGPVVLPPGLSPVSGRPRWRPPGLWY